MTGHLPDDWWTTENVATHLGVTTSTIRAYLARNQMPAPDRKMGPLSLWRPDSIREWQSNRSRAGKTAANGPASSSR